MSIKMSTSLPLIRKHFKEAAAAIGAVATPAMAQAAQIGPVTLDASPWMLLALPATAALWWLMKSTPRKPVQQTVPHIRLLYKLASQEQTPRRVPWWQYAAVATAVAGATAALTHPRYNPDVPLPGAGPVTLVVDNDWAAARDLAARRKQSLQLVDRADKAGRPVIIVETAAPQDGTEIRVQGPMAASEARVIVRDMKAHSWGVNYQGTLEALKQLPAVTPGAVIWLSNGLGDQKSAALASALQSLGTLSVYEEKAEKGPYLLGAPDVSQADLVIPVNRVHGDKAETLSLVAQDEKGQPQGQAEAVFEAGALQARATFKMPQQARNAVARVAIAGQAHVGAQLLVDEKFRRRTVGIIENSLGNASDPLTDENHYLTQAIAPVAEVKTGAVNNLLQNNLSVLMMADSATVTQAQKSAIDKWIREEGGTLIRFAGPRLAQAVADGQEDTLLPQPLGQTRILGNQTTGTSVGRIKSYAPQSPFKDITVTPDIEVTQQILPRAGTGESAKVWAQLEDNTPLVTARASGKGQIIFVHTTADPRWSNLAHSGAYVEMLQTTLRTARTAGMNLGEGQESLPPIKTMDAQGRLTTPAPAVRPLTGEAISAGTIGPRHPPGLYGQNQAYYAHNLYVGVPEFKKLEGLPEGVARLSYASESKDADYTGWAWLVALSALLAETGLVAAQSQRNRRRTQTVRTSSAEVSP